MRELSAALENQVQSALAEHPHLGKRKLRFEANEGRVTLHGEVRSYYQKQMAQEILRGLEGVRLIDNRLTVNWA